MDLVRATLGEPENVTRAGIYLHWTYPNGYVVSFDSSDHLIATLSIQRESSLATPRGLRLGDPVARAQELYGEPWYSSPSHHQYKVAGATLSLYIHSDRIRSISLYRPDVRRR